MSSRSMGVPSALLMLHQRHGPLDLRTQRDAGRVLRPSRGDAVVIAPRPAWARSCAVVPSGSVPRTSHRVYLAVLVSFSFVGPHIWAHAGATELAAQSNANAST